MHDGPKATGDVVNVMLHPGMTMAGLHRAALQLPCSVSVTPFAIARVLAEKDAVMVPPCMSEPPAFPTCTNGAMILKFPLSLFMRPE